MKKFALLLLIVVFFLGQLSGQEPSFSKGDKVINLGIGIGSIYYSAIGYRSQLLPLSVSFEIGIADKIAEKGAIGIGGYLGYLSYKYSNDYKTSDMVIGARGNFHYPLVENLDTYTGLMLGYDVVSYTNLGGYSGIYNGSSSRPVAAWFIGARYYFNSNIAVMAEFGYGVTYLNLGVAFKF
jgi:hypothetical protein